MKKRKQTVSILEPLFEQFCQDKKRQFLRKNITSNIKADICRLYEKNMQDEIIYMRKNNDSGVNTLVLITDQGIYARCDYHVLFFIRSSAASYDYFFSWEEIDRIEFSEKKNDFFIYFDEGYERFYRMRRFDLLNGYYESSLCNKVAEKLTEVARMFKNIKNLVDEVFELEEQGKIKEALELVNHLFEINSNDKDVLPFLHYLRGREYFNLIDSDIDQDINKNNANKAIEDLTWALEHLDEDWKNYEDIINFYLSAAYFWTDDLLKARFHCLIAMGSDNVSISDDAKEVIGNIENELEDVWNNYTSMINYKDRKFIMPIKDDKIGGCAVEDINVFRMSNIPSCFKFQTGHPIPNQLYIGHPYNPSVYVPFDESEDIFFLDKVHELCYLLECLGAEEINITSVKGRNVSGYNDNDLNISGNCGAKFFSANGSFSNVSQSQIETESKDQRTYKIKLAPIAKPYLPQDLIWYSAEPQWQRLVKSRLDGNMLEYNESVSTLQTKFTSASEKIEIKTSAKYIWAKLDVAVDAYSKSQFKESVETQWAIKVKFRSLEDFEVVKAK